MNVKECMANWHASINVHMFMSIIYIYDHPDNEAFLAKLSTIRLLQTIHLTLSLNCACQNCHIRYMILWLSMLRVCKCKLIFSWRVLGFLGFPKFSLLCIEGCLLTIRASWNSKRPNYQHQTSKCSQALHWQSIADISNDSSWDQTHRPRMTLFTSPSTT